MIDTPALLIFYIKNVIQTFKTTEFEALSMT